MILYVCYFRDYIRDVIADRFTSESQISKILARAIECKGRSLKLNKENLLFLREEIGITKSLKLLLSYQS